MENLVLIHGSLGTKAETEKLHPFLENKYTVFSYEIPHHGEQSESTVPFLLTELVSDLLQFIEKIGPCYLYGFSFGGYLALSAAIKDESNIKGIVTQGTKFQWNKKIAQTTIKQLESVPKTKGEMAYTHYLSVLHGDKLDSLIQQTIDFTLSLGEDPFLSPEKVRQLTLPVRLTRGGKDAMTSKEESIAIASALPNGHYFEIPHFIHPIGFIKPKLVARLIEVQLQSMDYQWVSTSFGKMTFQEIGKPKKEEEPVLLFLHESLGSIAQWKDFPQQLCAALNLSGIVVEFPGYGFSDSPVQPRDNFYLHQFSWAILPAFIDAIQLYQPLVIVGHSDGGTNALLFSAKYPKKVRAIITLAAHYMNEFITRCGILPAVDAFQNGKLKGLELYHGANTESLFHAWADTWLSPTFENWDISDDIKGNPVPAFIAQGINDQYGSDQQVKGITTLLPHSNPFYINDCGHQPHLEASDFLIPVICLWYKTILNNY